MPRPIRVALAVLLSASMLGALASPSVAAARLDPRLKTRMTGWVSMEGGFHLYRPGATARLQVGVWPAFPDEIVQARLEWRLQGRPWRLLDRSSAALNRDSRAMFQVRRVPNGYSFRIRVRIDPTQDHMAGRSGWSYFRAR
ncbi:MAG: hypothetical protein ACXWXG_10330 [Actinomycetota bacterium]